MKRASIVLACIALLGASPSAPTVTVNGMFVRQESLDEAALSRLPQVLVTATEHDGTIARYEGAALASILHEAGAPTGDGVRGSPARSYVAVEGSDGYIALFSLAELDTTATTCAPILADRRNGVAISVALGPFHVVAPCDRTQARSVRNVISLTVVTIPDARR